MWRLAEQWIDAFIDRRAVRLSCGVCPALLDACRCRPPSGGCLEEDHRHGARACSWPSGRAGAVGKEHSPKSDLWFLEDFFLAYVEDRRRETADDVMTKNCARTPARDGRIPEPIEDMSVATILFARRAGHRSRFLGNSLTVLAEHAELQRLLRDYARPYPELVWRCSDFNSPVKVNMHMAHRVDDQSGHSRFPRAAPSCCSCPAATATPAASSARPSSAPTVTDEHDTSRSGRGVHSCPGAPLVRADARVTIERMLDRLTDIRISPAQHGPPAARRYPYTNSWILRELDNCASSPRPPQ